MLQEMDTETHRYRAAWLDAEHELGQIAETLSDALGCTGGHVDALHLAEAAAGAILMARLREYGHLTRQTQHRKPRQPRRERAFA